MRRGVIIAVVDGLKSFPEAITTVFPKAHVRTALVGSNGSVEASKVLIGLGAEYIGQTATIVIDDRYASVYIDDHLVRHLKIDPARRYQPTGRRRGGPRRPRLAS